MTVGELKNLLEAYEDEQEVRLMTQQDYPFENSVRGVCDRSEFDDVKNDTEEGEPGHEALPCVFIVEGRQLCYGNEGAWEAAWSK